MFNNNVFKGKKILITGNTGFKGSWLTVWLLKMGARIYGISKDVPTQPSMFQALNLAGRITHYFEDIRNLDRIKRIIGEVQPDFLFHLAAQAIVSTSYADPIETISSNVMGTTHVLEALRGLTTPCFAVIITSDKCYDNVEWVWGYKETDAMGGKEIYSGSKGACELIFKAYFHSFFKKASSVKLVSARAGNVIGGGDWAKDRLVPDCMRAWSKGDSVVIRCPEATRPWQHVLEPLSGYLTVAGHLCKDPSIHGESFNFGPLAQYNQTVKDLLEDFSRYWHFDTPEKAYSIVDKLPFHEAGLLKLNCDKALGLLKWMPTLDYEKLIEMTSSWYYQYYKNKDADMYGMTHSQIDEYERIAGSKGIAWTK